MTTLARKLGLSPDLIFHDVYSLTDPDLLALIPRPVHALLVILPLTPTWHASRIAEDAPKTAYAGKGPSEPIIWFKQTIGEACGSIGLIHSVMNGPAKAHILPNSVFTKLRSAAIPLGMAERAQLLYDSKELEEAHQSVAEMGDTKAPDAETGVWTGHFVSFVKEGGKLWELEGSRKGPLERGELGDDEDVLSERALEMGLGRIIKMENESGGGELRFSCIALCEE